MLSSKSSAFPSGLEVEKKDASLHTTDPWAQQLGEKKLILRIKIKKAIFTLCSPSEMQHEQPASCPATCFQEGLLLPALASVRHHHNNKVTTTVGTKGNSPAGLVCRPS